VAGILSVEAGPPPPAEGSRSQTVGRDKGVQNKNSLKMKELTPTRSPFCVCVCVSFCKDSKDDAVQVLSKEANCSWQIAQQKTLPE